MNRGKKSSRGFAPPRAFHPRVGNPGEFRAFQLPDVSSKSSMERLKMSTIPVQKRPPRSEEKIDDTIDDSFPASDPPSYSRTARSGAPPRGKKLDRVDAPEGDCTPNDDKIEPSAEDQKDQAE
jgi:hypothetical protein